MFVIYYPAAILNLLPRPQSRQPLGCQFNGLGSIEQFLLSDHHRILGINQVLPGNLLGQLGHLRGGLSDAAGDAEDLFPQFLAVIVNSHQDVAEQIVVLAGQVVTMPVPFSLQLLSGEIQTLPT